MRTFNADGGLPLLGSELIGPAFLHGFTTRAGGVSAPPYDSLNMGGKWGDAAEAVAENRARVRRAAGVAAFHCAAQVHGARVLAVPAGADPAAIAAERADGLCSDVPGLAVAVYVADCVPLLLADPRTGACAAVHAGWRGTVAGIAASAVAALVTAYGARPADLRAALGPSIGPCCFEVGPEVAEAFAGALPGEGGVVLARGPRPHVDLRRALAVQLARAGLDPSSIDAGAECTRCDAARFYSYRRDAGRTGQHLAFIARRG